jgi:hypothetical protein
MRIEGRSAGAHQLAKDIDTQCHNSVSHYCDRQTGSKQAQPEVRQEYPRPPCVDLLAMAVFANLSWL